MFGADIHETRKLSKLRLLSGAATLIATLATGTNIANAQDDNSQEVEEVVITGSRIVRKDLTAPSPVVTLDSESILQSGETDLVNLLKELPILISSNQATNSAGAIATLDLRSMGTQRTLVVVNGRRHVGGISGSSTVDVSSIPTALVERVEVLTGGASAIYGADAVTGVVNYILKDNFEGIDTRAQYGISDSGDAENLFLSIAAGGNFADGRGNAVVAVEYRDQNGLIGLDRSFAGPGQASQVNITDDIAANFDVNPDASVTFLPGETFNISSAAGQIAIFGGGGQLGFDADGNPTFGTGGFFFNNGTLRNFNAGLDAGGTNGVGGDGILNNTGFANLVTPSKRVSVNANVTYEVAEFAEFFLESKFTYVDAQSAGGVNSFNDFIPIRIGNPFIPAQLQAAIDTAAANGENIFTNAANAQIFITRDQADDTVRNTTDTDRFSFRVVTGFKGDITDTWNYEVSYNYGRTESNAANSRQRFDDRFFASVDAVALTQDDIDALGANLVQAIRPGTDGAIGITGDSAQVGDIVCRSSIDPDAEPPVASFPSTREGFLTFEPGAGSPCVPTSIFGSNAINQDAADFIYQRTLSDIAIEQQVVSAVISGDTSDFFTLPAGAISTAFGFEYRRETSSFEPDAADRDDLIFGGGTQPTSGRYSVTEGFAEILIPIFADLPFAKELSVEGAYRYSDYSVGGDANQSFSTDTYRVALTWRPIDELLLRGGYSRAVRAPNIGELFDPQQVAFFFPDDPCDADFIDSGSEFRAANCAALGIPEGFDDPNTARFEGISGGNPGLQPETADTYTAGFVWTPEYIPGLSIAADYYRINLSNAIGSITAQNIVDRCVDAPSLNNQFCELQSRDPNTNGLNSITQVTQNIAALKTSGIDFEATYAFDLPGEWGSIRSRLIANYIIDRDNFEFQEFPDESTQIRGTLGIPKYNVNLSTTWSYEEFGFTYQVRYQDSQLVGGLSFEEIERFAANNNGGQFADPFETGDAFIHDISASWQVRENFGINAGVNNLFNRKPFLAAVNTPVTSVGRFFYIGFNSRF
ncbi:TonB-dependent receptor domain-containing protein [Kordiimonas laminariae]|uniref:TonB-dependent receptor domain-containing protein n=1 Tax=Kordiimonas laminariae TaxID=2917717 RepID=UPI001FF4505D|nr:TonB-dependent receptor [Kordiimonas laminariae]MCK0071151.1 TonB-dependent receptor [Kordiimonas laminariae]